MDIPEEVKQKINTAKQHESKAPTAFLSAWKTGVNKVSEEFFNVISDNRRTSEQL